VEAGRTDPVPAGEREEEEEVRAVFYDRYGGPDVLRVEEIEAPVPAADQIRVRIHASTVNRTDCGWRSGKPFFARYFTGIRRPKWHTPGMEFAGEVEALGSAVTEFAVGDRVFGVKAYGANAELTCIRESAAVTQMPSGMTFDDAAAVCDGACIALSCLRNRDLREGRRILIYGASGSVGTAAVQLARHFGAHVTAVCNTKNVELVRSLGADEVIDYLQADFTKNGKTYDVVFDAVGKHSYRRSRRSLAPDGHFVETDLGFLWHVPLLALTSKRVTLGIAKYRKEDVVFLKELIEAGEYRAVIDRRYVLEDVVDATKYVETGQKTGNVVLTLDAVTS
jgi:NADPH:quinone reductase-like Zn-dependent oxidoreductase